MKTQKEIEAIAAKVQQLINDAISILDDKQAGAGVCPVRSARLNGRINALETVLKLLK
jgi:hypothetical protein